MKFLLSFILVIFFTGCGETIINNPYTDSKTYIFIGDSTRAISKYEGQYLFQKIEKRLRIHNVNSILLARAGHTAKDFYLGYNFPTWLDIVNNIPNNGEKTTIDISLGINDYWEGDYQFDFYLEKAIIKIKKYKPFVRIILTTPNRVYKNFTASLSINLDLVKSIITLSTSSIFTRFSIFFTAR
jgi:hypothetical protein